MIFTNSRGESIEFGDSPFYLQYVDGLGEVSANIQTQKSPYLDGSSYLDSLLDDREIEIEFIINYPFGTYEDVSKARTLISRVCNPLLGLGVLQYKNDHVTRKILCVAEHVPVYPDNGGRTKVLQKGKIAFIAPDPFWLDNATENYKLEDFVAHFHFPFKFPVRFASRGDSKILVNNGDVPTSIRVTFRGEAINPKITNLTTDKFIKVNREIPTGYTLIIDTDERERKVKIIAPDGIEENAVHYIDLDSDFFKLEVGENKFSFITDGGRPEVYVEYQNRYLSV
ncbi:phage tail domain-containing protein [Rummeliibacillus sp. POC4]|uniref:phage distal tail protein n=1 Tax=Rummeliibacillus sp. POC4 TaxID=2305899 RepID=UPI001F39ED5F|nr:phage tail domain-containing protein [Rummeliibacillus sp. POC4]